MIVIRIKTTCTIEHTHYDFHLLSITLPIPWVQR